MDIASVVAAVLIAFFGTLLTYVTSKSRGDVRDLRAEFAEHRHHVENRIDGVETKLTARMDRLEESNNAIRSDITGLAVALVGPKAGNA